MLNLLPSRPILIADAREQMVPLVDRPADSEWPQVRWWQHADPKYLTEPFRTEQAVRNHVYNRCLILAAVFAMPLLAHLRGWIFPVAPSLIVGSAFYLAAGFAARPMYAIIRHNYRASRRMDLRAAYLSENLCPSCGFSLNELQPLEGFVVCPECASAWPV